MEHNFKALQNENYQLREYILNLQSRLLETQSDYPPAPLQANLAPSSTPATGSRTADPQSAIDSRLRRDMPPPPPDQSPTQQASHRRLQQAVATAHADPPQHQPPYGLGEDYPQKCPRLGTTADDGIDTKVAL